jgi:hypothetical protein
MFGQRADHERAALHLDARQPFDLRHVDDVLRPCEAKLHGRDQGVAAGEELRLLLPGQQARCLAHRGGAMKFELVHSGPYSAAC